MQDFQKTKVNTGIIPHLLRIEKMQGILISCTMTYHDTKINNFELLLSTTLKKM